MPFRKRVRPSHFFKVILKSTLDSKKLKIPEKFVRLFGRGLSGVVTLSTPSGQVWRVGLTKNGRNILFDDGWHDFIRYHSINVGYFLVFKYKKKSNFKVFIFDLTACEIRYHNSEDTDETVHFTTPKPPSNSLKNKALDKCRRSSRKVQPRPSKQNPAKPSFAPTGTPKFKCGYDKRRKIEEPEKKDKPTAEGIDIKHKKTAYKVGAHSSDKANKKTKLDKKKDDMLILLDNMGICFSKNFRSIAAEDKERAISAARLFMPKNPSFMLILRSSDIRNRHFYVPAEFAHRYFSSIRCLKMLDSEGRRWPVEISWSPGCFITRLGGFSKKLDEGDICVFELISKKKLKISILKIIKSESECD